ncbi:MAG: tetratricopeptide repeat protein [Saprospirales bacterium]|nr:tetratricopeptide repeat protein [Saprospirales bacterium]
MQYRLSLVFLFATLSLHAQIASPGVGKKTWAVIAGISDYQNKEISDLQYAHKDALAFFEYLKSPAGGSVPTEQIKLLVNEQATMAAYADAMDWLLEKAGEADQVYIYFSGHGDVENRTMQGFLLPWDSPSRPYIAGAYPIFYLQMVIAALSNQNKAKVIMVADACHAGKLAGSSIQGTQITNQNLQQKFGNEVKILACGPEELSQEGTQWGGGRGAFSYHLIDGLMGLADRDANYEVSLLEIRRYLEDRVPEETAPNSQVPQTIFDRNETIAWVNPEILAQIQKEKSQQSGVFSAVATRGRETQAGKADSLGQDLVEAFELALAEKRLLIPENNSAYYYYQQLSQRPEWSQTAAALRRNLAVALQDDAQQAINAYLNTDPTEMTRRWEEGPEAFTHIPSYLNKSAELLGPGHYMVPAIQSKQLYFEAMLLRMEGEEKESQELEQQALKKIEEAIALEPKGAHLYNELGLIQAGLGNPDLEEKAYRKANELAPQWVMPVYNLGISQREQGNPDTAKLWIARSIQIKPEFPPAQIQLALIEESKGNLKEAESAYLKGLELYKAQARESHFDPVGYYALGNIYLKTDRAGMAQDMYEKTIQISPQHPYAHYALGIALKRTGQPQKAIEAFKANLEITPGYLEPYYSISLLYAEQNDQEKALEWLEKALENGYVNKAKILEEEKFATLRQTERFEKLTKQYFEE